MANLLNKIWSGLDFWDKEENQKQRQAQAVTKEDERKRRADMIRSAQTYVPVAKDAPINFSQEDYYAGVSAGTQPPIVSQEVRNEAVGQLEKPKQSFWNKARDVFDANTEADKYRRAVGNIDAQVKEANTGVAQEIKPITLEAPGNVISNTVGAIPRTLNTMANQAVEVGYTTQQGFATAELSAAQSAYKDAVRSGDKNAIEQANRRWNDAAARVQDINRQIGIVKEGYKENSGGLFNAGTMYNEADSYEGSLGTGIRKIGGNTIEGMLDVYSLGLANVGAKQMAKQGFKQTLKGSKGILFKNAAANTGQGSASAFRQGGDVQDMLVAGAIGGTVGTAADVGLAFGGSKLYKAFGVGGDDLTDVATAGTVKNVVSDLESEAASIPGSRPVDFETPSYMRKAPQTIGDVQDQARMGVNNVDDSVFDADARTVNNTQPQPANDLETPTFIRNDPDKYISENVQKLQSIDEQIAALEGSPQAKKFAEQQEIADAYKISPARGRAVQRLIDERRLRVDTDPRLRALLLERQRVMSDLNMAYTAKGGGFSNVPDATDPIALAKANQVDAPVSNQPAGQVMADFGEDSLNGGKLRKVGNEGVDEFGNPVLQSDKQVAEEMVDNGYAPARGDSPVDGSETTRQGNFEQAANDEVQKTVAYNDPDVGPILKTQDDVAQEIIDLEASGRPLTAAQTKKLKELREIYKNFDELAGDNPQMTFDEMFPEMSPEGKAAAQATLDQLDEARTGNKGKRVDQSQQRGAKLTEGEASFKSAGGGVAGLKAKMSAMRGRLATSDYNPIDVATTAKNEIINNIEGSKLNGWEKLRTQRAFSKMWGDIPDKPAPSDIRAIRTWYNSQQAGLGDDVAELLEQATTEKLPWFKQVLGIPRTAMTTLDFSSLRQGGALMAGHPIQGAKAYINGIISAFTPNRFAGRVDDILNMTDASGANYSSFMSEMMNLNLPNIPGGLAEEAMSSARLLEKTPLYGRLVKATDRAFSGTLGELRFNVAKNWIDAQGGIDEVFRNFTPQQVKDMGEALNTMSGRGGKAGGLVDKWAPVLSDTLFSGRLWASRVNMLNPYFYYRLSGPARTEAIRSMASFSAMAGAVLTMANAQDGVTVEMDPRSSDFAKIKVGNTRYDILGGLQQNIRVASQIITGQKINSITGEMQSVEDEGPYAPTRLGFASDFLGNKLSPLLNYAADMINSTDDEDGNWMTRTDEYGGQMNVAAETGKLFTPLSVSGIPEAAEYETGTTAERYGQAALKSVPELFGAGVQTYGDSPNKMPVTSSELNRAVENEEYARAIEGYQAKLDKELNSKNPRSDEIAKLEKEIRNNTYKSQGIPETEDGIQTAVENGDWDKAIQGTRWNMEAAGDDGEISKKTKDKYQNEIKRYEVYSKNETPYDLVNAYESSTSKDGGIGVSDWRDMMESGNPSLVELATQLQAIDKAMYEAGAITEPKYYWGKGGRGGSGGGGGKTKSIATSINAYSAPRSTAGFKPQKATFGKYQSPIPEIQGPPLNDTSKLKKISVKRGGRA